MVQKVVLLPQRNGSRFKPLVLFCVEFKCPSFDRVGSLYSGFLPQSKDRHLGKRWTGYSKQNSGVSGSVSLQQAGWCFLPLTWWKVGEAPATPAATPAAAAAAAFIMVFFLRRFLFSKAAPGAFKLVGKVPICMLICIWVYLCVCVCCGAAIRLNELTKDSLMCLSGCRATTSWRLSVCTWWDSQTVPVLTQQLAEWHLVTCFHVCVCVCYQTEKHTHTQAHRKCG